MQRILVSAFVVLYVVVMGLSPPLKLWYRSETILTWQMFSGRTRDQAVTFTVHFPGGRTERLRFKQTDEVTFLYRPDTDASSRAAAAGIFNRTADSPRFGPPHFCATFPDAEGVSGRTAEGVEIQHPCPR